MARQWQSGCEKAKPNMVNILLTTFVGSREMGAGV
jgi:hypothetical protein